MIHCKVFMIIAHISKTVCIKRAQRPFVCMYVCARHLIFINKNEASCTHLLFPARCCLLWLIAAGFRFQYALWRGVKYRYTDSDLDFKQHLHTNITKNCQCQAQPPWQNKNQRQRQRSCPLIESYVENSNNKYDYDFAVSAGSAVHVVLGVGQVKCVSIEYVPNFARHNKRSNLTLILFICLLIKSHLSLV